MKKYLVFLFLIIFSCQKDEIIVEPTPVYNMIFENTQNTVVDGQDISFNLPDTTIYELVLIKDNSVFTKEKFTSTVGINTRKIYTKILPSGDYQLVLLKGSEQISQTFISVE